MPVDLTDAGTGNRLDLHSWFEQSGRIKIEFKGNNSTIRIAGPPLNCLGMTVVVGSECSIEIGARCGLTNTYIGTGDCGHIKIGGSTTFHSRARIIMHEPSSLTIGQDCMIASDVQFMTTDVHTIFDAATRRRINPPADIVVEDHVWIGLQCFIVKGVNIGHHSIIGLRSVVTRDIAPHCAAAGSPARVVRTGVDWDRRLWAVDPNQAEDVEPAVMVRPQRRWWGLLRGLMRPPPAPDGK